MPAPPFRLDPHDDPDFTRRLILPGAPAGRWLALTYAQDRFAPARRPMLRFLTPDGPTDALLPGAVLGRAFWLGPVPDGTTAILLAPPSGLRVEAARLLPLWAVLARAARRRPLILAEALLRAAQRDARRFRNALRIAAVVTPLSGYAGWRAERARAFEPALDRPPATACRVGLRLDAAPHEAEAVRRSLSALLAQSHRDWCLALSWRGAPPAGAALPRDARIAESGDLPEGADALGLLRPGDVLAPDALAHLAAALDGADLVYADEEVETPDGPAPRLKPAWSPDLALATGYPGRPMLVSRDLLARCGWAPGRGLAALAPACFLAVDPARVRRVPRILCRGPAAPQAGDEPGEPWAPGLGEALRRAGSPAVPRAGGGLVWPLPDPAPQVSVVIPTRDRPDLIRTAVRGVLEETDYPALDLVIVDNGSVDPLVHTFYAGLEGDPRVRRIDRPGPFNFSALVNAGVAASGGSVVLLLNNDVAVREPGWLAEMVRLAVRPGIGAVGAKLLYGNGRLQHAGVVVGLGGRAGHTLRNRPADTPGHLGRLRVTHEVSGVTAACLAVTRAAFDAVGGFDAEAFAVDFNDIDFCLRLQAAGYRNLWCAHAVLDHHESVSRGPSVGPARVRFEAEAARFSDRWRQVIRDDPFYHPAFSVTTFGEDLE
ncbi:glycosyltransferase [Methylobacterium sp. JK268]